MRNSPRSRLSPSGLHEAPVPTAPAGRRRLLLLALVAAGALLALAWFDGGEEALHPIAEDVAVPEQGQ